MAYSLRVTPAAEPIKIDAQACVGCGACVEACQIDVLLPGRPPVAQYPDECWYCGACVMDCPTGAISLSHPLMNMPRWVAKSKLTGGEE